MNTPPTLESHPAFPVAAQFATEVMDCHDPAVSLDIAFVRHLLTLMFVMGVQWAAEQEAKL